jgi:hypothetical protein
MTRKICSIGALVTVLAVLVPLSVTTSASEVNCRVPFSFIVAGKSMPAGIYSVSTGAGYMRLQGLSESAIALTMTGREAAGGHARLVFLKTGDRYDLAEVWTGTGDGVQVPASKRRLEDRREANAGTERIVINAM